MTLIEKKAVNGDSATQTDNFDADALKIINEINGESTSSKKEDDEGTETKVEKTPREDKKKSEDGEGKTKEDEIKKSQKQEEELKIPRSRLNKEIEKKQTIQTKYDKLVNKIKEEQDRLSSLSDEEKEEQANLNKLGMETKLSKLQEKLDDLKDDLSDKDEQIKTLQETINKSETESLSKRISELTKKHDGSDGLPKFDIKELLEFSKEKNFLPNDPIELYNFKYQAEIYAQKYEKTGTEIDKGNKGNFVPANKKPTFSDGDKAFEEEAKRIMDSIGATN